MSSLEDLIRRLRDLRRRLLAPPPKLTVSEWADRYRQVSNYSAEPGPWRTDRTPYLREIMDSFSDPTVNLVAFMKCARIGGTEAGLNIVGYFIDQDPSPILIVQPTVDDAKDFSKEQLAPMLADTPCLSVVVKDPQSRNSGNTVQSKIFAGGALYLVGANSPRGFRRRTARVVDLEEVDAYPQSAGTEGDPIKLATRRTATFAHRRKIYLNSTPTLKGLSRIEEYYLRSDQRQYHVPCPDCGHYQALVWGNLKYDPPAPLYYCQGCGVGIAEESKFRMVAQGRWVVTNPGGTFRGYHLNALYSPWLTWPELCAEWHEAQTDLTKMQVFINTALGEVWEDRSGTIDPGNLESRRESYPAEIPAWVEVLTAGVDVQESRLALVIRGWGAGEESALIEHVEIDGDPTRREVWEALDAKLLQPRLTPDGRTLTVYATGVDTGYHTESAYTYCKPRYNRRVYALKGSSTVGAALGPRKASVAGRVRVRLFLIGTTAAKDLIYARLKIQRPGPGYLHFGLNASEEYFVQLVAEQVKKRQVNGRWFRRYELPRGVRNEALDCEVYALAALYLSDVNRLRLGRNLPTVDERPITAGLDPVAPLEVAQSTMAVAHPMIKRPKVTLPRRNNWSGKW